MPENSGWFAGRALLISQVRTEFFVWVDDDFEFTDETNLEKLVEVISKTGYDVIGGSIGIILEYKYSSKLKFQKFFDKNDSRG